MTPAYYHVMWFVGALIGIPAVLTLRKQLGLTRTCVLIMVWGIAADGAADTLNVIVMRLLSLRYDSLIWPRDWPFIRFTILAIVATTLVVIARREKRTR